MSDEDQKPMVKYKRTSPSKFFNANRGAILKTLKQTNCNPRNDKEFKKAIKKNFNFHAFKS